MVYIDFADSLYIIHLTHLFPQKGLILNVAIIGGSIAGCALALLLKDKFSISVFERAHDLRSRGAGITLSIELLNDLINKNLIDEDTLAHQFTVRHFFVRMMRVLFMES